MNRPRMRVCLAQINVTVGDFEKNRIGMARAIRLAKRRGAALVTFPELCVTGYPPEDALFQGGFVEANLRSVRALAREARGIVALAGFVDRDPEGRLYNAAAVLASGRIARVYRKNRLPNYGVFDEQRYFHAGPDRPCVIELPGGARVGVTICEDIWQEDAYAYREGTWRGADLLVNLSASPYHAGKQALRRRIVSALARRSGLPVAYQNLVGGQDELVFDGGSFVVDAKGALCAEAARFREECLFVDLQPSRRRRALPKPLGHEAEVYEALVLGTRDYVEKNGFPGALIGLSGGIDSALVACIAVDALGAARVQGITMPSRYTSKGTYADAGRLASALGVRLDEFAIDPILDVYLGTLRGAFAGLGPGTAEENLQARIRGNLLMALSNKFGRLVLTTGNKSEFATGYCTLYGDMAGGFAVIKDVPKTLVFRLARYRNRLRESPRAPIPASTLRRPPSAELRPGQKDRDTLPPYPRLDRFLEAFVERGLAPEQIRGGGISKALAGRLSRMIYGNEYKRRQAPPGVKITPKAFGRDRRMPITNRFRR